MKIVIAGATGFIGQQLTTALLEQRHSVVGLTRKPMMTTATSRPSLEYAQWDGKSIGKWCGSVDGADAIINLCGESIASRRWSPTRKQLLVSSRLDPTNALVESIRRAKVKPSVLVNASAVGFYGDTREEVVTEDRASGDDFLGDLCVHWESAAEAAREFGVRVLLLRTGIVLDPLNGALQRLLLPYKLFVGGALGSGRQWFPWIHREDEIRSILFALETENVDGAVNLAAPEPVTMKEFSTALGEVLHRPSAATVPAFLLKSILGEMSSVVLTGQRAMPAKLTKAGFKFRFPTLKEALTDLLKGK